MKLKAVIFDMDGVLTDTVEYHYLSWKRLSKEYGIPFKREDNELLLGLTRRSSLEVILAGRTFSEREIQEMLRRKNEYFHEFLKKMGPEDLLPGVAELVHDLRNSNMLIGVASASQNVKPVLHRLGILAHVDAWKDGAGVSRSKPAPDVYLETASALRVSPSECIAVEDSTAGVTAARDAGMCVLGVGRSTRLPDAHAIVPNLSQIRQEDLLDLYARWSISSIAQKPGMYVGKLSKY